MNRRIAMISDHASPIAELGSTDSGGQNVYVAQVSSNLAKLGYEVDVFTRRDRKDLPEILEWREGVRVIHVPAGPERFVPKEELLKSMKPFSAFMIDFFRQQIRPYDLVHANFWMSGLVACEIKQIFGTPFVITFHALGRVRRLHQGVEDAFPDNRFAIEDRIVHEADHIIAECPQDEQDLLDLYRADPGIISVIPCGFDPRELWPNDKCAAREKLDLPQDEFILLQLGRMVSRKGVDTAIRGFARFVKEERVPARLMVVGGESRDPDPELTPEIGRLQAIAEEEGVSDKVIFTGRRNRKEILYYFNAADVFTSTPWYEPFGITPVEAMACGVPVIGSDVGGIKYTVLNGKTGFLIPPNDPAALAEKLVDLYRHPAKRKRFSKNAIQRAKELFTWQKVGGMIAGTYEEVLSGQVYSQEKAEQMALIYHGIDSAIQTLLKSRQVLSQGILASAQSIANCFKQGGKIMVIGNGGSAADAQHFAAELVGRFVYPGRRGLPVMALTADTAFLTAWTNDIGYNRVFSRQVETFGNPGDLLIGISTSGSSHNVVEAFRTAQDLGISCIGVLGGDGGELLSLSDQALVVPTNNTQRIQETHILILHLICELVEGNIVPLELAPEPFVSISKQTNLNAESSNGGSPSNGSSPRVNKKQKERYRKRRDEDNH